MYYIDNYIVILFFKVVYNNYPGGIIVIAIARLKLIVIVKNKFPGIVSLF